MEDAKALKKVLDKNVDKTWTKVEKELSHGPARPVPCPICGADLHVYDGESSYTPSIITRVIDCPACGASNALGLKNRCKLFSGQSNLDYEIGVYFLRYL